VPLPQRVYGRKNELDGFAINTRAVGPFAWCCKALLQTTLTPVEGSAVQLKLGPAEARVKRTLEQNPAFPVRSSRRSLIGLARPLPSRSVCQKPVASHVIIAWSHE